jgi:hypothetical protein
VVQVFAATWGAAQRTRPSALAVFDLRSQGGGSQGSWTGRARACESVNFSKKSSMPEFPLVQLLVVTALFAWFNFRAWQKRF